MANIDVQRKKSSPLPWIVLAVIILGILAYFLWNRYNHTGATTTTVTDSTQVHDTTRTYPVDTSKH
jgi:cytochrome c-type biogenesis protein CcmH/NrfG